MIKVFLLGLFIGGVCGYITAAIMSVADNND
jgi:hypothetical protein